MHALCFRCRFLLATYSSQVIFGFDLAEDQRIFTITQQTNYPSLSHSLFLTLLPLAANAQIYRDYLIISTIIFGFVPMLPMSCRFQSICHLKCDTHITSPTLLPVSRPLRQSLTIVCMACWNKNFFYRFCQFEELKSYICSHKNGLWKHTIHQ